MQGNEMRTQVHQWVAKWGIDPRAAAELFQLVGMSQVLVSGSPTPAGATEYRIQNDIRQAIDAWGGAVWRNNSGACKDETGRQIRYGLGNDSAALNKVMKSSDLIGIAPGGRFLAVEVKPADWRYGDARSVAQGNFLRRVNELGGIGTFANNVADVARAINT